MQGVRKQFGDSFGLTRLFGVLFIVAIGVLAPIFSPQARAATPAIVEHAFTGTPYPVGRLSSLVPMGATCASGEQLLSGGFYIDAGTPSIVGSFPYDLHSWGVDAEMGGGDQITVYVYCLQANYSLGTIIVRKDLASNAALTTINCPQGSTVLGGGYIESDEAGGTSYPTNNGWTAHARTVFVTCATQNFTAAPSVSKPFSVPSGAGNMDYETASCGTGQVATSGGFDSGVRLASSKGLMNSDGTVTTWQTGVAGLSNATTATAWVVCGIFAASTTIPVHITYQADAQWPGGFSTHMTFTNNTTTTIDGWTLQFTFPGDQKITQMWNGNFTQTGQQIIITNMSYNKDIAPGQTITLGFTGTWTSNDSSPTTFLLNGTNTQ